MAIAVEAPSLDRTDGKLILSFPVDKASEFDARKLFLQYRDSPKKLNLTVKPRRNKRSLEANDFMWALCQGIAEALRTTREEVYRRHIHDYGACYTATVAAAAAEPMAKAWCSNGIGWLSEAQNNYDGTYTLLFFPGSSTYDTAQMSRLIDSLVEECDDLGLECQLTPEERALLYE